jgi:hypothetical protein
MAYLTPSGAQEPFFAQFRGTGVDKKWIRATSAAKTGPKSVGTQYTIKSDSTKQALVAQNLR